MKGKLDGTSLRVPVPDGSITDFTGVLTKEASVDEVNAAFKAAAKKELKGSCYNDEPIVSATSSATPQSCTFDSDLTQSLGNLVKVMGWYDNEWGYSNRLVDLTRSPATRVKR